MANTVVTILKVKSLGKYGFFTNESTRGYNYSKNFKEEDKVNIVPGVEFEGEIYTSDSGAQYLNKLVRMLPMESKVVTDVTPPVEQTTAKKPFVPKYQKKSTPDNSMSKAEWQAKDRSQLIGGLSHDAAQLVAPSVGVSDMSVEDILVRYKEILEGMLKIREELK